MTVLNVCTHTHFVRAAVEKYVIWKAVLNLYIKYMIFTVLGLYVLNFIPV